MKKNTQDVVTAYNRDINNSRRALTKTIADLAGTDNADELYQLAVDRNIGCTTLTEIVNAQRRVATFLALATSTK